MPRSAAILYVDDEQSNRIVFEQLFADRFNIEVAASGDEALERLALGGVGVVISDQRMPGMTGLELLERVRGEHPFVVRIMLTAYAALDDAISAFNKGLVRRYIVKPWREDDLEEALRWSLEEYALMVRDGEVDSARGDGVPPSLNVSLARLDRLAADAERIAREAGEVLADPRMLLELGGLAARLREVRANLTRLGGAPRDDK